MKFFKTSFIFSLAFIPAGIVSVLSSCTNPKFLLIFDRLGKNSNCNFDISIGICPI